MKTVITLCLIQGVAYLFLLIPYSEEVPYIGNWFPLLEEGEYVMALRTYFWFLFNRINWVIMYYIVYTLVKKEYKISVLMFLIMEALIVIEFALNYNSPWFYLSLVNIDIGLSHFFVIFKAIILGNLIWQQTQPQ